jgi:hypothetical protein
LRKGDISNDLPRRIIVTTDTFLTVEVTVKKKLKVFPVPKIDRKINRQYLSWLYLYTTKNGTTLELVSYDMSEEDLKSLVDMLDEMGTNPFRYYTSYEKVDHLVNELPYRPEVLGVLDRPDRLLRYGHWGLDIGAL